MTDVVEVVAIFALQHHVLGLFVCRCQAWRLGPTFWTQSRTTQVNRSCTPHHGKQHMVEVGSLGWSDEVGYDRPSICCRVAPEFESLMFMNGRSDRGLGRNTTPMKLVGLLGWSLRHVHGDGRVNNT